MQSLSTDLRLRGTGWGLSRRVIRIVDDVSFSIQRGRTLGLVGESGCGKTTLARSILRLVPPTAGRVYFEGHDVLALPQAELRWLRRHIQIIFQDPAGSLNPRMNVGAIIGEGLSVHGLVRNRREQRDRVADLLTRVGLSPDAASRYPHEFSGGQRQRIGIARALALEPKFIVCDEPVSALDLSIQSQILNLLAELQEERRLSYLLIAHDLATVRHCSDHVAVMYLGRIVEYAETQELFSHPAHPYTRALLAAALWKEPDPPAGPPTWRPATVGRGWHGEAAHPLNHPPGCSLHPRCPYARARCRDEQPILTHRAGLTGGRAVACHFTAEVAGLPRMVESSAHGTGAQPHRVPNPA